VIELVQAELLVELGNAAAGIDQLLLASEEGVTLRAHFHHYSRVVSYVVMEV
jgi:hypothetical protein